MLNHVSIFIFSCLLNTSPLRFNHYACLETPHFNTCNRNNAIIRRWEFIHLKTLHLLCAYLLIGFIEVAFDRN